MRAIKYTLINIPRLSFDFVYVNCISSTMLKKNGKKSRSLPKTTLIHNTVSTQLLIITSHLPLGVGSDDDPVPPVPSPGFVGARGGSVPGVPTHTASSPVDAPLHLEPPAVLEVVPEGGKGQGSC